MGRVFVPMTDFLVPHFGRLWEVVKNDYPTVQHAPTIVDIAPVQDANGAWLPRVWFTSKDGSCILQLQQDRMYLNWRKVRPVDTYIRFEAIRAEYFKLSRLLDQFTKEHLDREPQNTRLDLTYVNVIPAGDAWSDITNVSNVLRDFCWQPGKSTLSIPHGFQIQWDLELPDKAGSLVIKANRVRRDASPAKDALKLELMATGVPPTGMSESDWLEIAHKTIVLGFRDITTEAMHRAWELQK